MATAGMETGQWYLMVGYIYDSGHTGTTHHPDGGIYDRNGKKIYSANSFKFTDSGSPTDGLGESTGIHQDKEFITTMMLPQVLKLTGGDQDLSH